MKIELLYDRDCPNVAGTRENLARALQLASLPSAWTEWERSSPQAPSYVRGFGSPTVLVNGRDLAGTAPTDESSSCRLYQSVENSTTGIPPLELIQAALRPDPSMQNRRAKWGFAALPGIFLSVLPIGACPACWPVYGGVLSALGLSFLLSSRYLFPLTAIFLGVTLFSLAYRAAARRGYGPFSAGLLAAALILYGKFASESPALTYGGVAVLIISSLWNTWPRRITSKRKTEVVSARCRACEPTRRHFAPRGVVVPK